MNPFEMVLGIVLIVGVVSIVKHRSSQRRRAAPETDAQADEDARRIRELEDRVRVLETIITDRRADLKREIDGL